MLPATAQEDAGNHSAGKNGPNNNFHLIFLYEAAGDLRQPFPALSW